MLPKKIAEGVWWIGAADWDRRLFDSLIPLPDGTSYNSYLVKGTEKTAILDTVDPTKAHEFRSFLGAIDKVDYIISHHAEQDHTGLLPELMERYPSAKVLSSPKGKGLLADHLAIPEERISTVADGETLLLGGKTIEFLHTPWVHWPETMCTYIKEDRLLFTCDLFGSHLASSDIFYADGAQLVSDAAKRYYAEVMMPFRATIKKHMERFDKYPVDIIAPSHGPVHKDPKPILEAHRRWVSDAIENTVIIPYATMHGSTQLLVERLAQALSDNGVRVEKYNLAVTDTGKFAMSLVDAATVVYGTPTVLSGAHPMVIAAAFMMNALKPKVRHTGVIGSYGWGGRAVEQITATLSGLKTEALEPVLAKGLPREADYGSVDALAAKIIEKHRELKLL